MLFTWSKLTILGAAVILLVACVPAPIRDIDDAPINVARTQYDLSDVTKAIKSAGIGLGWKMKARTPGHIVAILLVRGHTAAVDITYTLDEYSIRYRDSSNLDYDASTRSIHGNYNHWVRDLAEAIDVQLIAM